MSAAHPAYPVEKRYSQLIQIERPERDVERDSESGFESGEMFKEIGDINLAYLSLARKLILQDKAGAMLRLGIGDELADLMANMSQAQTAALSASNLLLCRLSLGHSSLARISGKQPPAPRAQLQASMLAAARRLSIAAA